MDQIDGQQAMVDPDPVQAPAVPDAEEAAAIARGAARRAGPVDGLTDCAAGMAAGFCCAAVAFIAVAFVAGPPLGPDPVKRFALAHVAPLRVDYTLPSYQPLGDGYGLVRSLARLGQSTAELEPAIPPSGGASAGMVVWDRGEPLAQAPQPAEPGPISEATALAPSTLGSAGPAHAASPDGTPAAAPPAGPATLPLSAGDPGPVRHARAQPALLAPATSDALAIGPATREPGAVATAEEVSALATPALPGSDAAPVAPALAEPAAAASRDAAPAADASRPAHFLQAGYFADQHNATALADKLAATGLGVVIRPKTNQDGQPRWVVLVGPYSEKSGALGARAAAPKLLAGAFPTTQRN